MQHFSVIFFHPTYIRLVYSRSFYMYPNEQNVCPPWLSINWWDDLRNGPFFFITIESCGNLRFFFFIFSIFPWTSWISIDMDGTVCRERKTRTRISVLRYREYNNNISHGHANLVFSCYWNSCGGRSPSFACPLFPATIRSPFACGCSHLRKTTPTNCVQSKKNKIFNIFFYFFYIFLTASCCKSIKM